MTLIHLVIEFLIFPHGLAQVVIPVIEHTLIEPMPITHFNLLQDYHHQNVKIKLPTKFKEILVLDYMPSIHCSAILSAYYVEMASQLTVDLSPLLQVDLVNTTVFTDHNHSFYTNRLKPF
jgi:hypothetical protein